MSETKKLFDRIQSGEVGDLYFQTIHGFDIEEFVQLMKPRIVQTSGADYAIAMHKDDPTDCSDRTDYFDWHSDGLYHVKPPRFVLLHCLDPGEGLVKTELVETIQVLSTLEYRHFKILQKLSSCYIGHGGWYEHPILMGDQHREMLLASRGHVRALPNIRLEDQPSIRQISEALVALYRSLDSMWVVRIGQQGDTIIFDQYKYMHRRNSATVDKKRKLIRMWWS